MRILESTPQRYDLAIGLLTLGRLVKTYDRLASHIRVGQRVLDLGCGTGALTFMAARRGAKVKAIDVNPQMLEIAKRRAKETVVEDKVELAEMGVAELDAENSDTYDVVMSGLCLSELSDDEITYTLKEVKRILKPGGLLLIADEIKPASMIGRLIHWLIRAPLVLLTYIITQQTTHAIDNLPMRLTQAGLSIESMRSRGLLDSFTEIVARKSSGAVS